MEDSSLQILKSWIKEAAEACGDAELLELVYRLLVEG